MPNWCHNEVTVQGEKKHVKEFMDFVKSDKQEFDFNEIVPLTTWTAYNVTKSVDPDFRKVKYTFDTACSVPSNILFVLKHWTFHKYQRNELNIFWFYREDVQQFCGYLHNEV